MTCPKNDNGPHRDLYAFTVALELEAFVCACGAVQFVAARRVAHEFGLFANVSDWLTFDAALARLPSSRRDSFRRGFVARGRR